LPVLVQQWHTGQKWQTVDCHINGMTPRNLNRFAAIACILAGSPVALFTVPWLPATVIDFVQLWHAPVPTWASESFRVWREARLHHLEIALGLYVLGFAAFAGLAVVAVKAFPVWAELLVWVITPLIAVSISIFWKPSISPSTNPTAAFILVRLPFIIAALAGFVAIVSFTEILMCRNTAQP
jgi:hypothetical protein